MRLLLLALKRERMFDQEREREREPKRERESEAEREREEEERKTQSEDDGEEEAVHEALHKILERGFAGHGILGSGIEDCWGRWGCCVVVGWECRGQGRGEPSVSLFNIIKGYFPPDSQT